MAKLLGNALFAPPTPFDSVVHAIAEHDCGWQQADRHPTLNNRGQPVHVFESDVLGSMESWQASVDANAKVDPYAGLLVSLHGMSLANHAAASLAGTEDDDSRQRAFRIRRFVHRQIEIQEQLRATLGMKTDEPLRGGLAEQGRADDEDLLRTNFFLLRFLDQLSLNMCFDRLMFARIEMIYPRTGENPVSARVGIESPGVLTLSPWPFNAERLELEVPARRMSAGPYRDLTRLRDAFEAAPTCRVRLALVPAGS
jgi:hypothetical protein